jgi:short-subunit dehydrogenase
MSAASKSVLALLITATAAARRMVTQRRGVILMMTTQPGRLAIPLPGPFGVACALLEAFARNLAGEVGPFGVRVNCLLSTGSRSARCHGRDGTACQGARQVARRDEGRLHQSDPAATIHNAGGSRQDSSVPRVR